jgi:hypothetical protein
VQISGATFAGTVSIPAFQYARVCGCYVVKPA